MPVLAGFEEHYKWLGLMQWLEELSAIGYRLSASAIGYRLSGV
jgi:hypothetical protein